MLAVILHLLYSTQIYEVPTIDKVIPATSHPPPMEPAPDDLPIALRKRPRTYQSYVNYRWIYTVKHNIDGSVTRLKAHLMIRGFTQQHDIHYEEAFSLVAKLNTVRVLVSLTVHHSWSLYQLDIKNSFLHSDLIETVYMHQLSGYETAGENHVCRFRKSLYGLKQSPRAWFEKLSKLLQAIEFSRSSANSSVFVHRRSQGTCDTTCLH
ncbi:Retrovirus-related Pol polyprotein from transposon RE1-like protein [Drosera capensis]